MSSRKKAFMQEVINQKPGNMKIMQDTVGQAPSGPTAAGGTRTAKKLDCSPRAAPWQLPSRKKSLLRRRGDSAGPPAVAASGKAGWSFAPNLISGRGVKFGSQVPVAPYFAQEGR